MVPRGWSVAVMGSGGRGQSHKASVLESWPTVVVEACGRMLTVDDR